MSSIFTLDALVSLITLTFLEIVLGIDNIIFISIASAKLHAQERNKARNIGLLLAMLFRVILLLGISYLISLHKPFSNIELPGITLSPSGQAVILFVGGLFLIYKATNEIFEKMEGGESPLDPIEKPKGSAKWLNVVIQIAVINLVFSIDSILTAIGLSDNLLIMIIAVILSAIIMMAFSGPVGDFVNKHPSLQVLGLSFLIMIGFMLIAEASHNSNLSILGNHIGAIPKGYLYFAIAFSVGVEFLNIRIKKKHKSE